jgi:hypothetical protein
MNRSSAVQVRNAEEREKLSNAERIARGAMRVAVRDSRLAQQVEQLDGVPIPTLTQEIYKAALLKLTEIATTDEAERAYENPNTGEVKVVTVANPRQLQALEILLQHRIAEGALLLKAHELDVHEPAPRDAVEQRNALTPEQAEAVLAQRRHFLAKVANEAGS